MDYNLGVVRIALPSQLDSFYKWKNVSDCSCCHRTIYCYSDRRYSMHQESGFIDTFLTDSLYQFTISHVYDSTCFNREVKKIEYLLKEKVKELEKDGPYTVILLDTVRMIRNKDFGILSIRNESFEQLQAFTMLNGEPVYFVFTQYKSKRKEFLKDMMRCLESIDVED